METHRTPWVQQRLVEAGRLKGKTLAIDATTLEANAAMRSISMARRTIAISLSGRLLIIVPTATFGSRYTT